MLHPENPTVSQDIYTDKSETLGHIEPILSVVGEFCEMSTTDFSLICPAMLLFVVVEFYGLSNHKMEVSPVAFTFC